MTPAQREILEHALGLNYRPEPSRNDFASAPDCDGHPDIEALVAAGMMLLGRAIPGELRYYHVTDRGKRAVMETER